ncbi:hypothetical protein BDY21DRAFT_374931 [Lineolata rhizophorae]|uniref:Phosphotransferase n=1 Tax=Lineolata rhizophorae TaxID=578093 RepID=A0A6A6NNL8_9PEZI|nr:hypothetical protein BDY21DRAFT_374931 [Lineolata rhizophorae]
MADVWRSIVSALEMVVMFPSMLHGALPPFPSFRSKQEKINRFSEPTISSNAKMRTPDEFLAEVRCLFEAPIQPATMLAMSARLQEQFKPKLENSNICMLPSFNHTLPSGQERGTYLALDVGGSTFRVALVALAGKQAGEAGMRIVHMSNHRIDRAVRGLEGEEFFDWMAGCIRETLATIQKRQTLEDEKEKEVVKTQQHDALSDASDAAIAAAAADAATTDAAVRRADPVPMGLSWSFPVEQTSIRNAMLLEMGKGFRATPGLLGHDLGDLVMQACRRQNLNVRVDAIVNDGSATLLARAYRDAATRMALILGTGTNAAVHLPVTTLSRGKYGARPRSWHARATHVLVNTELSMFGRGVFPTTRWDDALNAQHPQPDFQPLEYMISGRYLGEIARLVLLEAVERAALFGGVVPQGLQEPYALDTAVLAAFESDDSPQLAAAADKLMRDHPLPQDPSPAELRFVKQLATLVSRRAAAFLATAIYALNALRLDAEAAAAAAATITTSAPAARADTPTEPGSASSSSSSSTPPSLASSSSASASDPDPEPPGERPVAGLRRTTVGCNGTVIEKYPGFKGRAQAFLDELRREQQQQGRRRRDGDGGVGPGCVVLLEEAHEAAIFGAAVAACCRD